MSDVVQRGTGALSWPMSNGVKQRGQETELTHEKQMIRTPLTFCPRAIGLLFLVLYSLLPPYPTPVPLNNWTHAIPLKIT